MAKKEILHIIKGLGRGGAERLLLSTIRQHSKDFHFDVVYFLSNKGHLKNELENLGCTVTCLNSNNVFQILLRVPALVRLIRSNQYDLLHAHLPWAGIMARIAGKVTRVPVVYTEHNLFNRYNVVTRLFSKLTYQWQAQVIAVSERAAEILKMELNSKIPVRIINNGVDVREFRREVDNRWSIVDRHPIDHEPSTMDHKPSPHNLPENKIIIGTVTALTPQKRIDRWIRIAARVLEQSPDVYFVIVGDGVLREELEEQARPWTATNQLRFAGQSANPGEWLTCIDIFLMSSDFEGLPVALLEAMSMECAPVVTSVGGIPAVVEHEKNGFLYEPEDEDSAVRHILALVRDESRRKEIGKEARKTVVDKYSIERMVGELEEVYEGVIGNQAPAKKN